MAVRRGWEASAYGSGRASPGRDDARLGGPPVGPPSKPDSAMFGPSLLTPVMAYNVHLAYSTHAYTTFAYITYTCRRHAPRDMGIESSGPSLLVPLECMLSA